MDVVGAIGDVAGSARAVAVLPAEGPLPERTVRVPRERVGHALRRTLIHMGRPEVLVGTRFLGPRTAAEEVLGDAGARWHLGEDALRPLRLRHLFARDLPLVSFELAQLRGRAGWDQAFTQMITELEDATHARFARAIPGVHLALHAPPASNPAPTLEPDLQARWTDATTRAATPRHTPAGVQAATQTVREDDSEAEPTPERHTKWPKESRHGAKFGLTVHRALELLLKGRASGPPAAAKRAAKGHGVTEHVAEAQADEDRTMRALAELGIEPNNGAILRLEYPVAGRGKDGQLLNASIDRLAQVGDEVFLIEFKTQPAARRRG